MGNLYNLNSEQKIAMEEINNPVLILAGAGSGKTRVITHKFAYLIKEHGLKPWNILAVTFTNKAANEMKERVLNLINDDFLNIKERQLWVNTFHSICAKVLRRNIDKLGYERNFTIFDTDDCNRLLKEIYKSLNMDPKKYSSTISYISKWKNAFINPKDALIDAESGSNKYIQTCAKIYEIYEKKMKENNALDFDDLILKTIQLFQEFSEVLDFYKNLFEYIMVDEFQDTNYSQYLLIKLLSNKKNISVVGDDDQSIYSWRGADISNILKRFPKDYPNCKLVKLEQNYRSTNIILSAANSLIAKNKNRLKKNLWSTLGEGTNLLFFAAERDKEEAEYVGTRINETLKKYKDKNIAIFYRMNFQSRTFEEILRKRKIPYKIFGGIKFYERKEIKNILAYLGVVANISNSISIKRIINLPRRGIGNVTISKINELVEKYNLSFYEAIEYGCEKNIFSKATKSKLQKFLDLINNFRQIKKQNSIVKLFNHIITSIEYKPHLKNECQDETEYNDRIANIEELERSIITYERDEDDTSLENYLTEINLQTDIDELDENKGYVSLMTIHKAKGLEFNTVFVTGCDEGILPHYDFMDTRNRAVLEEERRLFYVALTRARKKLYLSSAGLRYSFGRHNYYEISSFIKDINPKYIENDKDYQAKHEKLYDWEIAYNRKKTEAKKLISKITTNQKEVITNINSISINEKLYHPSFGEVTVTNIKHNQALDSIVVKDKNGQIRNLILKYAKLSKTPY